MKEHSLDMWIKQNCYIEPIYMDRVHHDSRYLRPLWRILDSFIPSGAKIPIDKYTYVQYSTLFVWIPMHFFHCSLTCKSIRVLKGANEKPRSKTSLKYKMQSCRLSTACNMPCNLRFWTTPIVASYFGNFHGFCR